MASASFGALGVGIVFIFLFFVINKLFSPKTVSTPKDFAKLWLVRLTALYMLPLVSEFNNPTIAIVKENGIIGLFLPYILLAAISYGFGYLYGSLKTNNIVKKNEDKKKMQLDIKNVAIVSLLIIITYLLLGKTSNSLSLGSMDLFSNLSMKDLALVCKGEYQMYSSKTRSFIGKEPSTRTIIFKDGNFGKWNCEWTDKKIKCKDLQNNVNELIVDRLSSSFYMIEKDWYDEAKIDFFTTTHTGKCEVAKQQF